MSHGSSAHAVAAKTSASTDKITNVTKKIKNSTRASQSQLLPKLARHCQKSRVLNVLTSGSLACLLALDFALCLI